jgi:hypothetical protein
MGSIWETAADAQGYGPPLDDLTQQGAHVIILSGGYGAVLASEPIGFYDAPLKPAWWPNRMWRQLRAAIPRKTRSTFGARVQARRYRVHSLTDLEKGSRGTASARARMMWLSRPTREAGRTTPPRSAFLGSTRASP